MKIVDFLDEDFQPIAKDANGVEIGTNSSDKGLNVKFYSTKCGKQLARKQFVRSISNFTIIIIITSNQSYYIINLVYFSIFDHLLFKTDYARWPRAVQCPRQGQRDFVV